MNAPLVDPTLLDLAVQVNLSLTGEKEIAWIRDMQRRFALKAGGEGAGAGMMLGMALGWIVDMGVADDISDQVIAEWRACMKRVMK
jgi:hypothetical protein